MTRSHLLPVAFVLTAFLAGGCSRWIALAPATDSLRETAAQSIPAQERVPLVVDRLHATRNGVPQAFSSEMERRITGAVQNTHLFSALVPFGDAPPSSTGKTVAARLTFDETVDSHAGQTAWKSFVIGASMFLLAPLMELDYDYASHAVLELERWDGHVKRYDAQMAGTAHYHVFGATPVMIEELKGQVIDACLTDLIGQLVRDTAFYLAGSAPAQEQSVHSVIVAPRKPGPPAALSPTSTSSTLRP